MDKIKIAKVNEILEKGEPENTSKDHKGYSGYKPQAVIDALTEAEINWTLELLETSERDSGRKNKNGQSIVDVLTKVRVSAFGTYRDAVASHPIADDYGDAMKSAQTDAMKKAWSLYSVGSRAYHGKLGTEKTIEYEKSGNKDIDELDLD